MMAIVWQFFFAEVSLVKSALYSFSEKSSENPHPHKIYYGPRKGIYQMHIKFFQRRRKNFFKSCLFMYEFLVTLKYLNNDTLFSPLIWRNPKLRSKSRQLSKNVRNFYWRTKICQQWPASWRTGSWKSKPRRIVFWLRKNVLRQCRLLLFTTIFRYHKAAHITGMCAMKTVTWLGHNIPKGLVPQYSEVFSPVCLDIV